MLNPENTGKYVLFAASFTTTILNIYWFYYIMKKAIRMYNEEKSKSIKIDSVSISTCSTSNEKIE
jgi:hypothetical protein